jgi:hypothetical protein
MGEMREGMRMSISKRGFALTMDAAIAVLIAMLMIFASLFYLQQNSYSGSEDSLYFSAIDSLAVMEKAGALSGYAVGGNPSQVDLLFENLPYNTCAELTVYLEASDGSEQKIGSYSRSGCGYPDRYAMARRVFTSAGNVYLAQIEVWRR